MNETESAIRLRLYLGEDKLQDERPLYRVILGLAREKGIAGATVFRGSQGFGHSTRLHTADVLASEDLPILIEIIDLEPALQEFIETIRTFPQIGLITWERVELLGGRPLRGEPG